MPVGAGAQLCSVLQMDDSGARVAGKQVNLPEAVHKLTVRSSADKLLFHVFATRKQPRGREVQFACYTCRRPRISLVSMGSIAKAPPEVGLDQPTIDERRALIGRVAASAKFARSVRLHDFLLYVGNQSLKAGCPEIHEQEIGAKVFGRSLAYDRSQDNIVRVNATELRKRIDQYFANEGAHETLVLEIPRGAYRPVFHRRTLQSTGKSELALGPQFPALVRHAEVIPATTLVPRRRTSIFWAALCLLLSVACIVLFQQNRSMRKALNTWDGKPALAAFWAASFAI